MYWQLQTRESHVFLLRNLFFPLDILRHVKSLNVFQDVEGEVMLDLEQSFDMGQSWTSRGQVSDKTGNFIHWATFPLLQITVTSSRSGPNNQEQLPLKPSQKEDLQVLVHDLYFVKFINLKLLHIYIFNTITRELMAVLRIKEVRKIMILNYTCILDCISRKGYFHNKWIWSQQ